MLAPNFGLAADEDEPTADVAPTDATASSTSPEHTTFPIPRVEGPIIMDAILDEPFWSQAAKIPILYEINPGENLPTKTTTTTLVAYDDRNLYVAFTIIDPDPSKIRAHYSDRDTAFQDDFVGFVIDPFNDERRGYEFFVNPLGVQMDLFQDDVNGNEDASWNAIWDSAGRLTETGYQVEIAIPFSSLRFPKTQSIQTWGFNAMQIYPRGQRFVYQSQPVDQNLSCFLCQISKIEGFEGITPGRNIEINPALTFGTTMPREAPGGPMDWSAFPLGLTAAWGITPNLTLGASVNPDFSQVEADSAQLDVNTQFALFFPERRPFFLEGADFFSTPLDEVLSV